MNINEWFEQNKETVFRLLVYRKNGVFTPYETRNAFVDESVYEDTHYTHGKITGIIDLGEGKFMVEFAILDEFGDFSGYKELYNLDEIRLSVFDRDNSPEADDEEDSE